jgi:hypothetical protein
VAGGMCQVPGALCPVPGALPTSWRAWPAALCAALQPSLSCSAGSAPAPSKVSTTARWPWGAGWVRCSFGCRCGCQ